MDNLVTAFLLTVALQQPGELGRQADIAANLQTADPDTRMALLSEVARIGVEARTVELVNALAAELIRVNELLAIRRQPVPPSDGWDRETLSEYHARLIKVNAESDDPRVMPGLIGALGSGTLAIRGVAKFGVTAINPLLAVFTDPRADAGQRASAARTLGMILDMAKLGSQFDRREIVHATRQVLSRAEHFVVVGAAIDLAVTLAEASLIDIVRNIATDPTAAHMTGHDPLDRVNIQVRAKRALSGQVPR